MNTRDKYKFTQSVSLSTNYSSQAPAKPTRILSLLTKPLFFKGFAHGFRQPSALIQLQTATITPLQFKNLQLAFNMYFSAQAHLSKTMRSSEDIAINFAEAICTLQKAAGFPIFDTVQVTPIQTNEYQLIIPVLEDSFLPYVVDFMIEFFNRQATFTSVLPDKTLVNHIQAGIDKWRVFAPRGSNSLRFLQAAHANDIPWMFVENNTFQFGYGAKSRWLDSSFTDRTGTIATSLALNKFHAAKLLNKVGLPVPEQHLVHSENDALVLANQIGYPVVLKPLSEDAGRGVFARLLSDDAVKEAYHQVKNYSNPVLIEKHILGKDYRLQVVNGELVWAIERIPAGVTGDGKSTLKMLIDQWNNKRKASNLKTIELNKELIEFLKEQKYTLDAILTIHEFAALSRIANISAGGTPIGVFDKVHPDNRRLAETAANVLRLDIAGIDLIMPDIEQSYQNTSAAIIEVNAQPQFGIITAPHIYKDILLKMLPQKGRIPIIVIYGDSLSSLINSIQTVLWKDYKTIGIAEKHAAKINNQILTVTPSLFTAGQALLLNNSVEALIYHIKSEVDLNIHGLPFDAFDYLFGFEEVNANSTLLKACRGQVITANHEQELIDILNHEQ